MSEILSRITAHFDALGTRKVIVPEWGCEFHVTPVTVAERTRIFSGLKGENDYELCVRVLIEKARNEKGERVFTIADKAALLQKADSSVMIRVAAEILNGDAPNAAELKNS